MSTRVSTNVSKTSQDTDSKWNDAIEWAESELADLRLRTGKLTRALRLLKANRRDGIPWPQVGSGVQFPQPPEAENAKQR